MRKLSLLPVLIFLTLFVSQPGAAHNDQLCEDVFYTRNFDVIRQYVEMGQNAANAGDLENAIEAIRNIERIAASVDALCSSLAFNSITDGMNGSIGPINIPTGFYQAHVITNGAMTVNIIPLAGTCPTEQVLNVQSGQATAPDGAFGAFETTDCMAIVEVSSADQPWTLQFQTVDVDGAIAGQG